VVGAGVPRSHRLTPEQLRLVERVLPARANDLDASVRRLGSGKLDRLARHIRPRRSWDDIVLDAERKEQMRTIVHRYRFADRVYRDWGFEPVPSSGVVALFVGPTGTGKTMAAEIVAGELGLDLYKLDLSSVVSKYIGETEKNLEGIFDAAGAGNLVLFFDEADALFGKRSEVRDARDRYANIEVSYLLQRLESYDGLVVMATNFEKNIDEAFLRRIHVRVEFTTPGPQERAAIWELNLPSGAPRGDDVDITWLAEHFELTGAAIRNAAVAAAFAAAADASPITMTALVRGVAKEYVKLGRLVKPEDFGERYADLAGG
jgi:SpoVK/Ycf46/Vps4 family AAA+-type ATPase